ncbi:MAG TPA: pyruvate kinase [Acidimicrobiia bacterium]|nr:pyruvate kinase [Acidimicrobiia bacterium]
MTTSASPEEISPIRQTKIIATLGPAVASGEAISALVGAGMNVARLNFSHGNHENHRRFVEWVRAAAAEHSRPVAILQDIQGPKLRVGSFPGGSCDLPTGSEVVLVSADKEATPGTIPIDYPYLLNDVEVGEPVLLADGLIRLEVVERMPDGLRSRVIEGGVLFGQKGVAFPDTQLQVPAVTEKDRADLLFGRELGVDFVAASFVRSAADVAEVASLVEPGTPIIAKIELAAALSNLDEILKAADGALVARGDLGVQLPLQRVPLIQQDILRRANRAGIISITATEMLESMTESPRPTRAEVTDVASAIIGGTDAVMLSAETAVGRYPVRAVQMMDAICREVEAGLRESEGVVDIAFLESQPTFPSATAKAAVDTAANLKIKTIAAFTESGNTALLLSKYRPHARIIAFSPEPATLSRMALMWGVTPMASDRRDSTDLMIAWAEKRLERSGLCEEGEGVVVVAGTPPNQQASTNLMKLHVIGDRHRRRER